MRPIPYGRQDINDADIATVSEILRGDYLTQGPMVEKFEKAFAEHVNSNHAIAVNNGTTALHLCARALGVKPGDTWLTTPITFAASGNCILYCGGNVDFVDIDPLTVTLDLNQVEDKLKTGKIKGIVAVDYAGFPVRTDLLREIADKYGARIIEDACHAPGAWFMDHKGDKVFCGDGKYSDLTVFSFHPVKHITTGEGGMVTTNDPSVEKVLRMLRSHGITRDPAAMKENHGGWYMEMQELGYNYRIPDILCALGYSQLQRADEGLKRRLLIARRYDEAFEGLPVWRTEVPEGINHAYHLYVIRTNRRKELYDYLKTKNIFTQVHYIPMHTMPYYRNLGFKQGDFPLAEAYYSECLSLPMFPALSDEEQSYVIQCITQFFNEL